MKKVLFFAVALVALAGMASCANKEKVNGEAIAQDSVVTDTVNTVDTVSNCDTTEVAEVDSVATEAENN